MKPDYKSIFKFQIISWTIALVVYTVFRIAIAIDLKELPFFQTGYPPIVLILLNLLGGMLLGIILSFVDIYIIRTLKANHSFGYYLLRKSLIYIISIFFVLLILFGIAIYILDAPIQSAAEHFFARTLFSYLVYCILVSILIGFISQVSDKFGPGILLPMFLGKYHKPREEYKIFMFIDLTGSTTLAEKFGHVKYSYFIQDFLFDLNLATNQCSGKIYQYVGDEAIVTWDLDKGVEELNCINIFFVFRDILEGKKDYYLKKYGDVPQFKAGSNSGNVMVAEVGYLKKEIAFHGDPINTAARIRGLCNQHGKKFLISGYLKEELPENSIFNITLIAEAELRGKKSHVQVYSVERSD